ncbi:MAG: PD40 domain-containing protein [Anaerolineales bacterium]|nr:PD40 domain-containing protein [Anaerolineales bacterium]
MTLSFTSQLRSLFLLAFFLAACGPQATVTPALTPNISNSPTPNPVAGRPSPTPEPVATAKPEVAVELAQLGWITFSATEGGRRDIWVIRPDGSQVLNLTGGMRNIFAEAPVWSPDAGLIAYDGITSPESVRDIYLMAVESEPSQTTQLTTQLGFDCYPSFSPDGQHIVYMAEHNGNRELFIMDLEGNDLLQLTDHPAEDYEPAWSPDGERIAFTSRREGNSEIFIMDADGSNLVRLTDSWGLDWRPAWSPDGEWIAFESWRSGNADIFIMRPDGSDLRQLTTSEAEDGHPTWSPDGRYIVFHSQRTGNYQLFVLEVENPEEQWHLETGSVRALLPAWSPVAVVPGLEG